MTLKVLLVDDHQIFREALRSLLERSAELSVVGEAGSGHEVLELARTLSPDIVCMDIGMAGLNGIETTRQLTSAFPQIKVIALSTYADPVYVVDMMNAGAAAYVTKAKGGQELLRAIDAVAHDEQYLCPDLADAPTRTALRESRRASLLGDRERQVLCLVARGMSSQQIGEQLEIATGTVDVHRRNIMRKLDLHKAVELARYAVNIGLIVD